MSLLLTHDDKSIGLIGHTVVNYPSPEIARAAIDIMVEEGVSLIELQIPFSEPVADGPLFMEANYKALAQSVNLDQCFELMHEVTSKHKIPFVFMTYGNIIFKKGFDNFIELAKAAGAKGAIVPDLPIEVSPDYLSACKKYDFSAIQIIPPNISEQRLSYLAKQSTGFIYVVARSGVTGAKTNFSQELAIFIERIKKYASLPIAIGFGVRGPEDIKFLKPTADYAIVGTQALRTLQQQGLSGLRQFWRELSKAASNS